MWLILNPKGIHENMFLLNIKLVVGQSLEPIYCHLKQLSCRLVRILKT